ncbi:hypothetical protein F2Q70_00010415 [Brassica cretica]|uniref:Uncharacterized protein n=1 Tax=Brassica cretica TaxID=69181 RepID=A0A8S9LUI3_BRACR|nr:hypothetical protein F2Q70_00010415 [Brassica cretica]
MHGLMLYRRFGRARSLRSDRAERTLGRYVATERNELSVATPPHLPHDFSSSSIFVTAPSWSSPSRNPLQKLWNRPSQLHRVAVLFVAVGIEPRRRNQAEALQIEGKLGRIKNGDF